MLVFQLNSLTGELCRLVSCPSALSLRRFGPPNLDYRQKAFERTAPRDGRTRPQRKPVPVFRNTRRVAQLSWPDPWDGRWEVASLHRPSFLGRDVAMANCPGWSGRRTPQVHAYIGSTSSPAGYFPRSAIYIRMHSSTKPTT